MSSRSRLRKLNRHRVPTWWSDAKLGIFVHWTPASVPGWAPVDSNIGKLLAAGAPDALAESPYTEWYENSLRFPGSSVSRHHHETYGDKAYADFAGEYCEGLASWDPDEWARRFAATGARYVVLVAKHHDGWCLWPTQVPNPRQPGWHSDRDVVGELREAVLGAGMRFGLYYSGGLDWTFEPRAIGNLGDLLAAIPRGAYRAYADAQVRELIDRYRPSVLWNDIAWPSAGSRLWPLMAHYYQRVPDGVLNDRWMPWNPVLVTTQWKATRRIADNLNARATGSQGGLIPPKPPHFDVRTPEYVTFRDVQPDPWECVRGIDQSFGYNRNSAPEHFLDATELLAMTTDIVSKGGNLLLNVGPRGEDARIPSEQLDVLDTLTAWTHDEGRSVFGSRPWIRPGGRSTEGRDLRFWACDRSVFVAVGPCRESHSVDPTGSGDGAEAVTIVGVRSTPTTEVSDATGCALSREDAPAGIRVHLPAGFTDSWPVIELRGCTAC